jgi:serine/threonine protein kinase
VTPDLQRIGTYELPRGSVVGKYEIMRRLAVGGMAEIYLARVTGAAGFEKLVVLKRILPSVAEDPTFVQMFLDEAKIAATLRHPNIADVYDVGEAGGTYFFTMEYVYGQDVRAIRNDARKREEQIPLPVALAIVHGTASALEHAHGKVGPDGKPLELVHRDVSASNIMVSYDGAVKLLDFGIARAASSTHKTQTGTLKGKIPYMSPEQCRGLPMDRRSDLFSLGVVFYEMTVGRRPFRGDSDFDIMDQIVHKGARKPSELVQGFPPELEAMIMRLLDRAPAMRYATGEDLLHDLDTFIAKHGLWLSPRAISKYMRTLFADKIEAWEHAEQEGVAFSQHLVQSITSQSQRSELVTPPSSFPGLPPRSAEEMLAVARRASEEMMVATPPPRTTSSEMAAVVPPSAMLERSTSKEMAAVSAAGTRRSEAMAVFPAITPMPDADLLSSEEPHTTPMGAPAESASQLPVASLQTRSGRTIALAFAGALVVGAGGVFGFLISRDDDERAAAVAPQELAEPEQPANAKAMPVQPAEATPDATPGRKTPAEKTPAEKTPAEKTRADNTPADNTPAQQPTVLAPAPVGEDAPDASEVAPSANTVGAPPPSTRKQTPKPTPKSPQREKVKPKHKPESKEQPWDPNSPFLPR